MIQDRKDLSFVKHELVEASKMAKDRKDPIGILGFGIASAQLDELSTQVIGFTEVKALPFVSIMDWTPTAYN